MAGCENEAKIKSSQHMQRMVSAQKEERLAREKSGRAKGKDRLHSRRNGGQC